MIAACTQCHTELTAYELRTVLGREGLCAGCATVNMIDGGMDERLASLYYEKGHDDAIRDQVLRDQTEV
jgi:PHP family Zn ribbon phosphoesterase